MLSCDLFSFRTACFERQLVDHPSRNSWQGAFALPMKCLYMIRRSAIGVTKRHFQILFNIIVVLASHSSINVLFDNRRRFVYMMQKDFLPHFVRIVFTLGAPAFRISRTPSTSTRQLAVHCTLGKHSCNCADCMSHPEQLIGGMDFRSLPHKSIRPARNNLEMLRK